MKSILLSVISFLLVMNVCGKNDVDMRTYLKKVLGNLGKIESASYHEQSQSWQPGDTVAITNFHRFIKEYTNPFDSTIGASYVCLDAKDTTRFEFGYDGNVRMISYHEHKGIMIDDFTTRSLPFRLVAPPFFCYTRNIIGYALSTGDSITTEWKDLGEAYYFKLVIHEDRQVEFFGKAYYIPKPPFDLGDPTSIYELWISKADGLPYKMRREMSHQISATTCSDVVLNQLSIAGLNLYDYVPQDYEIRKYGEQKKVTQPAATDLIGQKAPDWMLKDMYEKPVALSEFKSKVLLVNLTGIGCGACHASIPFLNGLKGKFNTGEFEVVSIETWGREPHSLRTYADKNQINYSFLCGDEGIVKSYRTYGAAPLFFILDQDRVIRKVIRGYRMGRTDEEITDAIKALL
ncbi:TlpA family protein disulfide reductase [Bacteroides fragilis]|uniref:TlpA family protein disulfide reductase n=1 Tax=Bacteroides fragilis TaxID=817 RepID=UPI0022AA266B|nr:TlpA disulfide reductase family protein [Bacteroides fragilis]MCZ2585310.1 TlpA disulfide reductase family protein [Bacteroides fragilis]